MNGRMDEQAGSATGFLSFSPVDLWGQMDDSWLRVGSPLQSQELKQYLWLLSLDASSNLSPQQVVATRNISRRFHMAPGGKVAPVENYRSGGMNRSS